MALYAFDGTWQKDEIDDEKDTNICREGYNNPPSPFIVEPD